MLARFMNSRGSFRILQARTEIKKRKKLENKNNFLKENSNGVFLSPPRMVKLLFIFIFFLGGGVGISVPLMNLKDSLF